MSDLVTLKRHYEDVVLKLPWEVGHPIALYPEALEARLVELEAQSEQYRDVGFRLMAALSKIDYLCGKPNEMQLSDYDLHGDEQLVVKAVERLTNNHMDREQALEYLDNCIRFWRKDTRDIAASYVDAFQSVRISLFGKLLPVEE